MGASTYGAKSAFVLTTGLASYDPNTIGPGGAPAGAPALNFDELKLRLWNPLAGTCVSVKDPTGDLREVGMIYDHTNMWANVQTTAHPWHMHWQLGDLRHWRPFFGPMLPPRPLATVQTPPSYSELSDRFYEELEGRVEENVRDALQSELMCYVL